jgi:hypothetical protein
MTSECIKHSGYIATNGYGYRWNNKKLSRAHRVAWIKAHGPIPDGLYVLHRCDNPSCVNVDHLFLGTQSDNLKDASNKGRLPHRKLTDAQVSEIKILLSMPNRPTHAAIAKQFGLSRCYVSQISRGERWT